jgi:hypothetical protein
MTADTTRPESEVAIFSRFSRAFSHVVRGDLSVITNEVSYLATRMPCEELGRVRNRCAQIAATVSKMAGLRSEMAWEPIDVEKAAAIFGARLTPDASGMVSLDRVKIERLASIVRHLFGDTDVPWNAEWSEHVGLSLSIRVPKPSGQVRRYSSWSSFAAGELSERAVIDAVVADLIMRAHEWRLAIDVEDRCVACHIFIAPVAAHRDERQCA